MTKELIIKNLYGDKELLRDVKEQVNLWGDKFWDTNNCKLGIDLNSRPTSGRPAYLPNCIRKLWKRHLIMNLSYLNAMYKKDKESLEIYLNKRFGKWNWFYGNYNSIKVILVKNILNRPYSPLKNKWSWRLSSDREYICLRKVPNQEMKVKEGRPKEKRKEAKKIGEGFFIQNLDKNKK